MDISPGLNYDVAEVKLMAALLYTPEQVGEAMDLVDGAVDALMATDTPFRQAYRAGFYESDVKLRDSVLRLALAGSGPAQALLLKMKQEAETREFYGL